jgi:hypothetical protein
MKKFEEIGAIFLIALFGSGLVAAIVGWLLNIMVIIQSVDMSITGMFVLRCVGIFVAPLGAILGYF